MHGVDTIYKLAQQGLASLVIHVMATYCNILLLHVYIIPAGSSTAVSGGGCLVSWPTRLPIDRCGKMV